MRARHAGHRLKVVKGIEVHDAERIIEEGGQGKELDNPPNPLIPTLTAMLLSDVMMDGLIWMVDNALLTRQEDEVGEKERERDPMRTLSGKRHQEGME